MKKTLLCMLSVAILTGCNDSDDKKTDTGNIPIVLSSRLTVDYERNSRQDIQIASGQQVSFFVTRTNNINDVAYNNIRLEADGDGGFGYYLNDAPTTLYYPIYTDNVDFYGIHPYSNITLGSNHTFNIQSDQSEIRNFLNSDLLYVRRANVARTSEAVPLVFNHKLTKLNFIIRSGDGTDLTGLSRVLINNVNPTTNINTANGALVPITENVTTTNVTAYGIADNTANVVPQEVSNISAIIVPQNIPSDVPLFTITINGVDFTYRTEDPFNFLENRSYKFTLTLNNTVISVSSSIDPWLPGEDTEGIGVIE